MEPLEANAVRESPAAGLHTLAPEERLRLLEEVERALKAGDPDMLRGEVPPKAVFAADQLLSAGELDLAGRLISTTWEAAQEASIDTRLHTLEWLGGIIAMLPSGAQARLFVSLNGALVRGLREAQNPNVYAAIVGIIAQSAPGLLSNGQGELIEPFMRVLSEHASSPDDGLPGRQQVASRALTTVAAPAVLSSLVGEFQCGDRVRQSKAARVLVACGGPAAEALVDLLSSAESVAIRMRAVSALRAMGAQAVPPLMDRLAKDQPWYVQRNAIAILRDIGDESVVGLIAQKARHPHMRVRLEAMSALGKFGGPQAVAALLVGLDDRDASVREQTIVALGNLRVQEAVPRLTKLIGRRLLAGAETDDAVQCAACAALGQIGDNQAIAPLLACLRRGWIVTGYHAKSDAVRCSAAQALASFPSERVRQALAAASRDGSMTVRAAAAAALRRLDTNFSPAD